MAVLVLDNGIDEPARHAVDSDVLVILDVAEPGQRSDPDAATAILEERCPALWQPADIDFCDAAVARALQPGPRTDPDAAVAGAQHRRWVVHALRPRISH